MPETPDFEQIARDVVAAVDGRSGRQPIVDALRLVWNARGAADIVKLDATITEHGGVIGRAAQPGLIPMLDRALRTLDR